MTSTKTLALALGATLAASAVSADDDGYTYIVSGDPAAAATARSASSASSVVALNTGTLAASAPSAPLEARDRTRDESEPIDCDFTPGGGLMVVR